MTWAVWARERVDADDDLIMHECVVDHETNRMLTPFLDKTHLTGWSFILSPLDFGIPVSRQRRLTIIPSRRRAMLEMMGSPVTLFGRQCVADASIFFCASDDDVKEHFEKVAAHAKKKKGTAPRHLLTSSVQRRLDGWEDLLSRSAGDKKSDHLIDLKQSASYSGRTHTEAVPCILRGSILWHHELQRGPTTQELMVMMGFPYSGASSPFRSLFRHGTSITPGQWTNLIGNGIHCCVVGAVLLWGLAHVAPPSRIVLQAQLLPPAAKGQDEDLDDEYVE